MCGWADLERPVKWHWHVKGGREKQESIAHRGAALLTVCEKDKESFRLFFLRHHLTFPDAIEALRKIFVLLPSYLCNLPFFMPLLVTNNPLSSSLCAKSGL